MTQRSARALCTFGLLAASCRQAAPPPPPLVAQVSGTIDVSGLAAPARIVRDRWGVPHIYAESQEDLFFAQGFAQAQDRLFQMDLWRRSAQGRLSQVLGANFIERDAMTRRIQYRGDANVEWASYGPDARAIAAAFVRGVNAWVALARDRPPEEFVLAGWKPEYWSPNDLLNRTDAFMSSGDAIAEVRRAKLSDVIAEAIARVGAPPFFAGLAAEVRLKADATYPSGRGGDDVRGVRLQPDQAIARSISRATTTEEGTLSISEAYRNLAVPSPRYFVHLKAPGWNVIGATAPWLPGVALGHNERVAWGMSPIAVDTQDVHEEAVRVGGGDRTSRMESRVVTDAVVVKGRRDPFVYETELAPHGFVVAADRERGRVFILRWSGTEAGAAAELGALALDRAQSWTEFRAALTRWRMPARRVVYADVDGNLGFQDAALIPLRLARPEPVEGGARSGLARSGSTEWVGWVALDQLPHAFSAPIPPGVRASREEDPAGSPAVFAHVLGITDAARRLLNVGPLDRPADDSPVRFFFDTRNWDGSRAINAPGQSESPASPHYSDLAAQWAAGGAFPLAFSDEAVAANAEATLTIVPKSTRSARP